ncbi:MAG TPA: glycosyltransferase [Bacteroidia bacterium]|nr:glycosyltransferase [Bacteroidia bacterium]
MSKIIIIGPAYPLRGGIANFNEALCATYNRMGQTCSIVSFSLQYPGFLFPGTTQFAGDDKMPEDVQIKTMINSINPFSWWKTAQYIRKEKPEKVIIRYWLPFMAPCLGTIARWVKRGNSGIKVEAICDNVIPHEKRIGDDALTSYFLNGIDSFTVMSRSVLNDLRKFTDKPATLKFHPVYNIFGDPVSKAEGKKQLGLEEHVSYILFFGFIRHYKGLDLLLEAFSQVVKNGKIKKDVKLLIAGEFYDDPAPYRALIEKTGISERVLLHDKYISKESVKFYFAAADLVAQPYRDATQSGVTQIAYHFGRPMLVTNVGGLPEIVPNGISGLVTEVNAASISQAIVEFYNSDLEEKLTQGSQSLARSFSWEEFVKG